MWRWLMRPSLKINTNLRNPESATPDPAGPDSLEVARSNSCCSQISLTIQQSNELILENLAEA